MASFPVPEIASIRPGSFRQAILVGWAFLMGSLGPLFGQVEQATPVTLNKPPFIEFRLLAYGGQNYPVKLLYPAGESQIVLGGDSVRIYRYSAISLPQNGRTLNAYLASPQGAGRYAVRLRYKLEGYDPDWRDFDDASMHLVIKFFDGNKIPVSRVECQNWR